jgi:hypothetical protein
MHRILLEIASEWTAELLEFEGDASAVHAYWEEQGGAEAAIQIIDWLHALDEAAA